MIYRRQSHPHHESRIGTSLMRYGSAILAVLVATLIRWLLNPFLQTDAPLFLFIGAVLAAARLAGISGGLLATGLGALAGLTLFVETGSALIPVDPHIQVRLVLYLLVGIGISLLGGHLNKTIRSAAEEKERFRLLSDTVPGFLWTCNRDGQCDYLNARWAEYSGIPAEEQLGYKWLQRLHPDDRDRTMRLWRNAVEHHAPFDVDFRIQGKDGTYRWFKTRATAKRDEQGRILKWFGANTDITEQRRIEEALRESESKYHSLFEAMQEGFALCEILRDEAGMIVDWRYLDINPAFEAMLGVERSQVIDRTYRQLFPESKWDSWGRHITGVISTGKAAHLEQFDMGRNWEATIYSPVPGHFAVILSDTTEQKRMEEGIRQQKQLYETLAEHAPEVIARFDTALRHIYINDYGARVYGIPKTQVLGKTNEELGFPLEKVRFWEQRFSEVLAAGLQRTVEFDFDSPNLGHQCFSSLFVPERDETGTITSILAITRDVTEQKALEDRLRQQVEEQRIVMDVAPVAIWVSHDPACDHIVGNRMADHIYEAEVQENVSAQATDVRRFFSNGRELQPWELPMQQATGRGVDIRNAEFEVLLPSSRSVHLFGNASPLRDNTGQIRGCVGAFLNVTERKRIERELQDTNEQLRTIMDSAQVAICVALDPECRFMTGNPLAHRLLGIPGLENISATPSDAAPAPYRLFIDGSEVCGDNLPMQRAARTGQTYPVTELDILHADGSRTTALCTAAPVRDAAGRIRGSVATLLDIDDRKRDEQLLREKSARLEELSAALDLTHTMVFAIDGTLTFWSAGAAIMYGWLAEEAVGRCSHELLCTEFPEPLETIHQHLLDYGSWQGELRHRHRHGRNLTVASHWSMKRDIDGRPAMIVEVNNDITELREAQAAVRQSEARLSLVLEHLSDGVVLATEQGEVFYWNPAARTMHGLTSMEDGRGTLEGLVDVYELWAADRPTKLSFDEWPMMRIAGGESVRNLELRLRHVAQGWERVASYSGSMLETASGERVIYLAIHDLTEQRHAEAALRESEVRFRTLANAIPQLCWMAKADGWIFWFNERWYDYTGTSPEQMEGWGWRSVHDPNILPAVLERWNRTLVSGEPFDMVFPLRGADGVFRPFLTRVTPLRDSEGKIVRWFGTNTDISDLRRVEAALRESRAKLEAALNSMPEAVFISDADGHFVDFNDSCATFYRFADRSRSFKSLAEYPSALEVCFPDGASAPYESWAVPRALRGETATNAEYMLRRRDTGETWIGSYSFGPIRDQDGCIVGAVVVARDITERKRAERELRLSEERFRKIFQNAGTGIAIADFQGRLLQCNSAYCALLGYNEQELLGTYFNDLIFPDDRNANTAQICRLISGEAASFQIENRFCHRDGSTVWVQKYVSVLSDASGNPSFLMALITDITERKRVEEEVRQLNTELEKRVRERTGELEAANNELEAFAYSVAHDLRAPLRGIDGWSLALAEEYHSKLDDHGREYLNRIRSDAQRLGRLIDDLLQLSRVTRLQLEHETVDLTSLAEAISERLQVLYTHRDLEFVIMPGLSITGDARLLEIALTNLLDNAAKFTAYTRKARIEVGRVLEGERPFYIRDNGVGFDMAYAGTLFTAFHRLHKPSEFPGSGIGLATVQRVIARHTGRIWAEAEPHHGATFYFAFPER